MTISRVSTVANCWQWANFTMGPNGQYHFGELRQKVCLYIHAVVLLKRSAKFGRQKQTFCAKKRGKKLLLSQIKSDRL